jgi:hypothetical protein
MGTPRGSDDEQLYQGLKALAEASFPKRCQSCGRVFNDAAEFAAATDRITGGTSGLKQAQDDSGRRIVELFRNCPCGSTLMEPFGDRRADETRRAHFDSVLTLLETRGFARNEARIALRKIMRGENGALPWDVMFPGPEG